MNNYLLGIDFDFHNTPNTNWRSKIKLQIACPLFLRKQESKDLLDSRLRGNDHLRRLHFTFDSNLV